MESQKARKERRRIWRKLHLAADSNTHEVVCADLSLNNVTDLQKPSRALSGRLTRENQGQPRELGALRYPAFVNDELRRKNQRAYSSPKREQVTGPVSTQTCNRAVANQLAEREAMHRWKWTMEYNRRSIAGNGNVQNEAVVGRFTDAA